MNICNLQRRINVYGIISAAKYYRLKLLMANKTLFLSLSLTHTHVQLLLMNITPSRMKQRQATEPINLSVRMIKIVYMTLQWTNTASKTQFTPINSCFASGTWFSRPLRAS